MTVGAVCSLDGGEPDSQLRAGGATSPATPANEPAVRAVPACSRMMTRFASPGVTIRLDKVFGSHRRLWPKPGIALQRGARARAAFQSGSRLKQSSANWVGFTT